MSRRGYMSIFFSLSLLCICALLFAMVETARMAGARWYLQTAVNSSMDSVFSQYHRELWEQYRLLFVEYASEDEAAADFKKFLTPYLNADNWYPMEDDQTEILQLSAVTDSGGDYLEAEILDYMKYGIWDMVFQDDQMEMLVQSGMESEAVHEIAGSYRGDTKAAWRLEEALEQIQGCLEEQQKYQKECYSHLDDYYGTKFRKSAAMLIHQLERIPALVKNYEKRADSLLAGLSESEQVLSGRQEKLSEAMYQGLEQEMQEYASYIAKDGERRKEIEGLSAWSEVQIDIVKTAIELAEDVTAILDDWDDEEEEPDLDALWGRVVRQMNKFDARLLSVSHGIQDKEKQNWLEQAERFFQLDLLSVVLPEGVSPVNGVMDMNELPSGGGSIGAGGTGVGSGSPVSGDDRPAVQDLASRLLVTQYCGMFYSDFRKSVEGHEGPVFYELEYLFAGEASEARNLELTARHLLLLREGWNLIHIFSDGQKRAQARELATMIVGATGIVPLVLITTFFIMSVWALGEAIMDLRRLMDGEKVPLLKSAGDWQLSLEQLLQIGQDSALPRQEKQGEGLAYQDYLKFMLFFSERRTLYYRMMDLIQINIRRGQDSFRMINARYRLDIRETVVNKHVFLSPVFVRNYGGGTGLQYRSRAETQKAY